MYIGTESNTVCTLSSTNAIPSNVSAIYVPYNLQGKYKTATNWSSFASKIQGYEQPVACQSLIIAANDVAGYQTFTTIHWEATCTYSIEGMMQTGTMVFKGDVTSDTFGKNPSSDSSRSIEVSYTFLGKTATATITQGKYVGDSLGGTIFYIDDTADGVYEFYDAKGNVAAEKTVRTAGRAAALKLCPDRTVLRSDGEDLAFVNVSLVDKEGNPVPVDSRLVKIKVSGAGSFKAVANGDPTCLEPFQQPRMHLFSGQLTAIVQSGDTPGEIVVEVEAKGVRKAVCTIRTEASND